MPDHFFDSIDEGIASGHLPEDELAAVDLITILSRFASINATIRWTVYSDNHPATISMMQQLLGLDNMLNTWEASAGGKWAYTTHRDLSLPASAAFHSAYHRYADVWTSRIWNHFRWARTLTNQLLLDFVTRFPGAAATDGVLLAGEEGEARLRTTIRRLAVDILTSVPTHYKHPLLSYAQLDRVQTSGGAGAGAVGIPHLMFHLQVAACAPGVDRGIWEWAVELMETAWGDLGMLHAKSLAEVSREHRTRMERASLMSSSSTKPAMMIKMEGPWLQEHYGVTV